MGYGLWVMGYGLWVMGVMGYGLWVMGYGLWVITDALRAIDVSRRIFSIVLKNRTPLPAASRHALVIPEYVPGESLAPPPQATVAAGLRWVHSYLSVV